MKGEYSVLSFDIKDNVSKKNFDKDIIFYESEDFVIRSFGMFLNTSEGLERYNCENTIKLIKTLYLHNIPFPTVLNGSYVVVLYDIKNNRMCLCNDLLSKHALYYYYDENSGQLLFADSFFDVLEMVKNKGLPYTIDELGVKMMMWQRMFYDNVTYIREIKFLRPFDHLIVENGKFEIKRISREQMYDDISMEAAASEIHKLFSKAVKLQYAKNQEYDFPQIATISGGMDSRSTFLYGLANGYTEQTGFCYGESSSTDYHYALQLAKKNNCQFFFHPIDNGYHLLERDEMCNANEAQAVYSGPSGAYDSLKFYNTDGWGIVHTGLGGGEIMGDMRVNETLKGTERIMEKLKYRLGKGKKDRTWESFVSSLRCTDEERKRLETFYRDYNDFNEFQSLNDMRRCLNLKKMGQAFGVEFVSPFLYEDFFCYMLRIPYKLTKGRQLYLYWQKKHNPKQFETPSTFQMGCKPGNKLGYYVKRFYKYAVNRMGYKTKYDMVPIEQWMAVNPRIEETQQKWFEEDLKFINDKTSLHRLLSEAWRNNTASRQTILTAMWALKEIKTLS